MFLLLLVRGRLKVVVKLGALGLHYTSLFFLVFFFSRHARRKVFWGPQCALASANSNFPHEMFASEVQTKIHCFSVYHYAEMLMTA